MHGVIEHLHPWLLIVRQQHALEPDLLKPAEQLYAAPVRWRPVGYQRIIDIEDHPPVSLPVISLIIYLIRGIQIIRIKSFQ